MKKETKQKLYLQSKIERIPRNSIGYVSTLMENPHWIVENDCLSQLEKYVPGISAEFKAL